MRVPNLPVATQFNGTDSAVINQGGVVKQAAANLIAPSSIGALATANNLSEVAATASAARSNLGLVIDTNVLSVLTRHTLSEAATLTLAVGTDQDSTASGTLTTIAFSGSPAESSRPTVLRLLVTGGPRTLTIPTSYRIGEVGSTTSVTLRNGNNELSWVWNDSKWWLADTGDEPTYTVATLPSSPATGLQAVVTDGDSALAWGAVIVNTGSGATTYYVWYTGAAWHVFGK